jgi:hypothetical protein
MVEFLETLFPRLVNAEYHVTSPVERRYNCIAWAADDVERWWWPELDIENGYWPEAAPLAATLEAFEAAFATLGYSRCDEDTLETGFERIAVFADGNGIPTHAARQLSGGPWTSKLGKLEDIEHELHDLSGDAYGSVALIMRRPKV